MLDKSKIVCTFVISNNTNQQQMKTVTIQWKNTQTNELRNDTLTFVGTIGKCQNVWVNEKGEYYTKGIAGWINVSKYIN